MLLPFASPHLAKPLARWIARAGAALFFVLAPSVTRAQAPDSRGTFGSVAPAPNATLVSLDSLVRIARANHPAIRAARSRVVAARLRVGPAGARPDPMLMAGVQNLPLASPSFTSDAMTMKMIGIAQTVPAPGKLALRTRAARAEADAADAQLTVAARAVEREVRDAYFDVTMATELLAITSRGQTLLAGFLPAAEAQYASAGGAQIDVVKARLEATRLAADGIQLAEDRRASLARLAAALVVAPDGAGRSHGEYHQGYAATGFNAAFNGRYEWPERVRRAALGDTIGGTPRFTATTLDARLSGSSVPSVDSLFAMAVRTNADLRAHEAMIGAAAARAELAGRATHPDIDVGLQYGQRAGRSDMITASISIPLPLQHRSNQDAESAAAHADLDALEAEHGAQLTILRRAIARLASALERDRTQLAIYRAAIIPQARAGAASLAASYGAGRGSLSSVVDAENMAVTYEAQYVRALGDFAKALAELEQLVGAEVVP